LAFEALGLPSVEEHEGKATKGELNEASGRIEVKLLLLTSCSSRLFFVFFVQTSFLLA